MFHLLHNILSLKDVILADLRKNNLLSNTPSGKVRVAPIVELLSDAKQLYKLTEKIMTKLHRKLPHESIYRLRVEFTDIFNGLHGFYSVVGRLAYFSKWDLVSALPSSEPVFLSADRAFIFTEETGAFASIELRPSSQLPPYKASPLKTENLIDFESKEDTRVAVIQPLTSKEEEKMKPEGGETLIRRKDKKIKELKFQNQRLCSYYKKEIDRMQTALTNVQSELVEVRTELKACHEEP